ncbi:MAG: dTMP kinase [Nitrospirae bacterium]|nr:dTMP kinase [Candidatus Troglogloeales bacterium]MBI3598253.1 dTMP kinase [Candidatus Troglogloeales bacterium]
MKGKKLLKNGRERTTTNQKVLGKLQPRLIAISTFIYYDRSHLKGYFITFEGGEGSGKTTQLAHLARHLQKKGYPVLQTREPGGTLIGEAIRSLLLYPKEVHCNPEAELFLYLADRAQHVKEVILPALSEGQIVLCDRFSDSTLVYQGIARGIPLHKVLAMTRLAADGLKPNLTFLLDIDLEKGLSRLKTRKEANRLDLETDLFHYKVREGYLALAKDEPKRIHVVNAAISERRVFVEIRKVVDGILS